MTLATFPKAIARNGRRGVALVDVIIGTVMLGVGLAVVVSLASRSLRSQTDGEKQMVAAWLADELITLVLVEGPVNYNKANSSSGRCAAPFEEFSYDIAIADQGVGQPFRVTATIRWPSGRGDRNIQVQTLIADNTDLVGESRLPVEPIDRIERWSEIENGEN